MKITASLIGPEGKTEITDFFKTAFFKSFVKFVQTLKTGSIIDFYTSLAHICLADSAHLAALGDKDSENMIGLISESLRQNPRCLSDSNGYVPCLPFEISLSDNGQDAPAPCTDIIVKGLELSGYERDTESFHVREDGRVGVNKYLVLHFAAICFSYFNGWEIADEPSLSAAFKEFQDYAGQSYGNFIKTHSEAYAKEYINEAIQTQFSNIANKEILNKAEVINKKE